MEPYRIFLSPAGNSGRASGEISAIVEQLQAEFAPRTEVELYFWDEPAVWSETIEPVDFAEFDLVVAFFPASGSSLFWQNQATAPRRQTVSHGAHGAQHYHPKSPELIIFREVRDRPDTSPDPPLEAMVDAWSASVEGDNTPFRIAFFPYQDLNQLKQSFRQALQARLNARTRSEQSISWAEDQLPAQETRNVSASRIMAP